MSKPYIVLHLNPEKKPDQRFPKNAKHYNPKSWQFIINTLKNEYNFIQLVSGVEEVYSDAIVKRDMSFDQIAELCKSSALILTIDSFLPHLCNFYKIDTPVIVIWTKNNPDVFGYPNHIHLFKDRKYFRVESIWGRWDAEEYKDIYCLEPQIVVDKIREILNK